MTYTCGELSWPFKWLDLGQAEDWLGKVGLGLLGSLCSIFLANLTQPYPTNQHLGQGQIRGLSQSALMYYILYFYVQPFYIQSSTFIISTFIVFYIRVLLRWDPFYIESFYLQSSTFSLLRSVFLHSIPPSVGWSQKDRKDPLGCDRIKTIVIVCKKKILWAGIYRNQGAHTSLFSQSMRHSIHLQGVQNYLNESSIESRSMQCSFDGFVYLDY